MCYILNMTGQEIYNQKKFQSQTDKSIMLFLKKIDSYQNEIKDCNLCQKEHSCLENIKSNSKLMKYVLGQFNNNLDDSLEYLINSCEG